MKSIERAHVVVVAAGEQGRKLTAQLGRMRVAQVSSVNGIEEARRLCAEGRVTLCLVAVADPVLDAAPAIDDNAPGQDSGIPSLMLTGAVTAHSRRIARHAGYSAAISCKISPQMLYRRIGAALQRRRSRRRPALPVISAGVARQMAAEFVDFRKPTLH